MKKSKILKRIFSDDIIIIPAVDGSKTITNSEDVFKSWIDSSFEDWGLNKSDQKTPEIKIQVYEMVKDANYSQMFHSLNNDLDKLCLTQHQITVFCANNQKYLREGGWPTFFLFKVDGKYYVAYVLMYPDGLYVNVHRFKKSYAWYADLTRRLVVPQPEA
jgi:hypothetical protein